MDATEVKNNPNPRENANIFSILFFGYTIPTFKTGLRKEIDVDDVYNPLLRDKSDYLGDLLEKNWLKQVDIPQKSPKKKPSLFKAIVKTFWIEYALLGILTGIGELGLNTFQPILLGGVLDYYTPSSSRTKFEAYMYALGLVTFTFCSCLVMNQFITNGAHSGMRVRASVCSLLYRKATKLSRTALGDTPPGKVVNLLSNDVARFDFTSLVIHELWTGPVSAIIIMAMLYQRSGLPGIAGILVVILMAPLHGFSGKFASKYRKMTALKTDERIRLMDEVINGIQVIKMYAWEIPFQKVVESARRAEIKIIRRSAYTKALFTTLGMVTTRVALFATLLTISLSGEQITAAKVFVLMSYFNMLSTTLNGIFMRGVTAIAELFTSINRIQNFLENEEYKYEQFDDITANTTDDKSNKSLIIKNLSSKWNVSSMECVLQDITFEVKKEQLVGIIGPVGAGKSSLLQTCLGELHIVKGSINALGKYSYASQEPWIFANTIRQNILFGAEYDKKRYKEVLRICALETDLNQFSKRDLTIVGDKGASLSGGQKARITLARAVYRDVDIYLLDDPLSAVDIHVSKILYEECINGFLRNKTRILVTHQVHYLKNADKIIILNNGKIENEGTFDEIVNCDNLYAKFLMAEPEISEADKTKHKEFLRQTSRQTENSNISRTSAECLQENLDNDSEDEHEKNKPQMRDMQEDTTKGKVKGSLLIQYFRAGASYCNVTLVLLIFISVQLTESGVDYFISFWTNVEEARRSELVKATTINPPGNVTDSTNSTVLNPSLEAIVSILSTAYPDWSTETCLYVYGGMLMIIVILMLARSFSFYSLVTSCSQNLHNNLFQGTIYANMRFFDINPSGRVLNRFSADIGSVDEGIPWLLLQGMQTNLQLFGALVLVMISNPYAIIMIVILALFTGIMRHVYLKTSRNLKRVSGMLRSPVFTHLSATLQGLPTVRALRAEKILQGEFDKIQNYQLTSYFMSIACGYAFAFSLDLFSCVFVAVLVFSMLTFDEGMGLSSGSVGLAISQALSLTGTIQFAVKLTSEIANQMTSVERILEYAQLPSEPQPKICKILPKTWPDFGSIRFEGTNLTYFEDGPTIIKDLTLNISSQEKIGIVGRTGAGKSSLISTLFRLANVEGKIIIDGVDIKEITLRDLRSNISIIPQDPVLFSGTLRYNLDPFGEYTDAQLYKALEDVELKDPNNIINRLENTVMDKGSNYSMGQRQLICLARAVIRNNKILVLDEATANVDPQTDALIQKTIRSKFTDCTVLTVAHRLNTIMDSDKVLVMDQGTVAEFDHPHILLQNKNGIFCKMVDDTGSAVSEQLKRVAKNTYQDTLNLHMSTD